MVFPKMKFFNAPYSWLAEKYLLIALMHQILYQVNYNDLVDDSEGTPLKRIINFSKTLVIISPAKYVCTYTHV